VGNQTGGRVFLFLFTDDFLRDYEKLESRDVEFVRPPQEFDYGKVAVFKDLYGNLWDLIEPNAYKTYYSGQQLATETVMFIFFHQLNKVFQRFYNGLGIIRAPAIGPHPVHFPVIAAFYECGFGERGFNMLSRPFKHFSYVKNNGALIFDFIRKIQFMADVGRRAVSGNIVFHYFNNVHRL
jgi:hypothetical protein